MVLPQYRRRGIGATLTVELESIARKLGYKKSTPAQAQQTAFWSEVAGRISKPCFTEGITYPSMRKRSNSGVEAVERGRASGSYSA